MEVERLNVTIHWKEGGETDVDGEINSVLDKITDLMIYGTKEDIGASFTVGEEIVPVINIPRERR